MKKNKLGLGAEIAKQKRRISADEAKRSKVHTFEEPSSEGQNENVSLSTLSSSFIRYSAISPTSVD